MYRLENPIQHYAWGSTSALPEFLGTPADGRPYAELWMGTHPIAPSRVLLADGSSRHLDEIAGALPYLFKVLAAVRPLSLQVHPHREMARAGFDDEEARGVRLEGRERVFKDPNHKPELTVALTPFETLVGFRTTAELLEILPGVGGALTSRLAARLRADPGFAGIVRLLGVLLSEQEPVPAAQIQDVVEGCAAQVARGIDPGRAYSTVGELAAWHPDDPGVVAGLLLNRVALQPGEALFLAHGIIHAHLSGTCLEVMACSDNVLRAGLTEKHIQSDTVLSCLEEGMSDTFRIEPKQLGDTRLFLPPVEEFALAVTSRDGGTGVPSLVPGDGPRIALCVDGVVELRTRRGAMRLRRGGAVFVPAGEGEVAMTGIGTVAQVYAA